MNNKEIKQITYQWLGVIALVYLLIIAVSTISLGFKSAVGEQAQDLFAFATNPFSGLIVGTLATALIQSSSTVTSIIVGLVAGGLPVTVAVPMVMGANIGTTITNTLVSLGQVSRKDEFQRAFAAATIHDFFNLMSVAIFLPGEIFTHFLEKLSLFLSHSLIGSTSWNIDGFNFIAAATTPVTNLWQGFADILPRPFAGLTLIAIGIILIFVSILYLGKLLKILVFGKAKQLLQSALGRGSITGIIAGTLITILVQSSSTTTSLIVPLAGMNLLTLEDVYPFTLGANIGTCITALIAATAVKENQVAALEIALVHLLYNTLGVILIYGIPILRMLPILAARMLAAIASERKFWAIIYILTIFFLLPSFLLGVMSFPVSQALVQ